MDPDVPHCECDEVWFSTSVIPVSGIRDTSESMFAWCVGSDLGGGN
jgi:hypothetical protein